MTIPRAHFPMLLFALLAALPPVFAAPVTETDGNRAGGTPPTGDRAGGTPAVRAGSGLWTPVRDEMYLQESGRQVPTDRPVFAIGVLDGQVIAGFGNGVMRLAGDRLEAVAGAP